MKKILGFLFIAFFILACGGKTDKKVASIDAKKLFKVNCMICHGADGKLGANGSKDLTKSPMTLDDRIAIITNGKNAMTPYKGVLSEDEIKAVAAYTFQLK